MFDVRFIPGDSHFIVSCFSGAIEFSSEMGLDAFFAQTGLKMVSTMHTSTEVDGLIKLDESRAITAKFNMPKEKIEILNVK